MSMLVCYCRTGCLLSLVRPGQCMWSGESSQVDKYENARSNVDLRMKSAWNVLSFVLWLKWTGLFPDEGEVPQPDGAAALAAVRPRQGRLATPEGTGLPLLARLPRAPTPGARQGGARGVSGMRRRRRRRRPRSGEDDEGH